MQAVSPTKTAWQGTAIRHRWNDFLIHSWSYAANRSRPRASRARLWCRLVRSTLALAVLLLHLAPAALADPNAELAVAQAEEILRFQGEQERQRQQQRQLERSRPPQGTPPQAPVVESPSGGECIDLELIEVTGVTLLSSATIDQAIAPYQGRCLALEDLNGALQQLSFLYVKRGYVTSRAYLPEQDLSDGALEIVVVEGFLEAIVMDGEAERHAGRIGTAFPGLQGSLVNLRDIEQGLDQLNRLASNQATIELAAGAELGGSLLHVNRAAGKRWQASIGTDNLGGAFTGQQQTRLTLGYDDLVGINDQWSASYQRSTTSHPLDFADPGPHSDTITGSLSVPYGYTTLAVNGTWNQYQSQLAGQIAAIETSGNSKSARGSLTQVIYRDEVAKLSAAAALNWQATENFVAGQRVEVSSRITSTAAFDLVYARQLFGGQATGSLGLEHGLDIWGAASDAKAAADAPRAQFRKITYSLGHAQPLRLGPLTALYSVSLSGQWSPDLLFGAQQMSLGGTGTIRGVREAVLTGNLAQMMRNDFTLRLPAGDNAPGGIRLMEPYLGLDVGRVLEQKQYEIGADYLAGATLGVRLSRDGMELELAYADLLYLDKRHQGVQSGVLTARASLTF